MSAAEIAIRMQRAAFNRALAEGDLAAIGPLLTPDCVLVTGTDSAVLAGRKAQLAAWKREFAASPGTLYLRTTESVTVSPVEPIALEAGSWSGAERGSGSAVAAGRYSAKWRETPAGWQIVAEIFVTLA